MKLTRLFGLLAVALTAGSIAHAEGMFSNLPVVGGSSYCALYAGDGTTCVGTVPAGPTVVTGNERIPADTVLPNGQSPQSVRIPLAAIGALPYQYAAPLTGTTVAVAATTGSMVIDPAGTIAALTLTLPAASALVDNQTLAISSSQTITSLTLTPGSGTTVSNSPTALTISTTAAYGYKLIYRAANTKWYRLQ